MTGAGAAAGGAAGGAKAGAARISRTAAYPARMRAVMADQSNCSRTKARPAALSRARSAASPTSLPMAAANSSAVSATSRCSSWRTPTPSIPAVVETVAQPIASAFSSFRRIPPP